MAFGRRETRQWRPQRLFIPDFTVLPLMVPRINASETCTTIQIYYPEINQAEEKAKTDQIFSANAAIHGVEQRVSSE